MKKLLTFLGAMTISAASGAMVVSCSNNKQEDTGTIFIDNGGDLKFDTTDLLNWSQTHQGFGDSIKVLKDFYKLFAVSLMSAAQNKDGEFDNIFEKIDSSNYSLNNLKDELASAFGAQDSKDSSTVRGAANNAFKKKEEDIDNKDKLIKELAKQFPGVRKEYDTLKKAFINNEILTNSSNSAYAKVTNILASSYNQAQIGTSSQTKGEINNVRIMKLNSFITAFGSNTTIDSQLITKISTLLQNLKEDENKTQKIALIDVINATGGSDLLTENSTEKSWDPNEIKWISTETKKLTETEANSLAKDIMTRLDSSFDKTNSTSPNTVGKLLSSSRTPKQYNYNFIGIDGNEIISNSTFFDLVSWFPNYDFKPGEIKKDSTKSLYGFLSESQRFLMDQYFTNQKPVAIQEVVYSKSGESSDLTKNITGTAFFDGSDFGSTSGKQFTKFLGFYDFLNNYVQGADSNKVFEATSQTKFDTIFGADGKSTKAGQIHIDGEDYKNYFANELWTEGFSVNNGEKLLTLEGKDYANIEKYAVYDFLNAKDSDIKEYKLNPQPIGNTTTPKNAEDIKTALVDKYNYNQTNAYNIANQIMALGSNSDAATKSLFETLNLIHDLNRKIDENGDAVIASNGTDKVKTYQVLNKEQGIIAFVGSEGLHITKVVGYDMLKSDKSIIDQKAKTELINSYAIDSENFLRLEKMANNDQNGDYRYAYQNYQKDDNFGGPINNNEITDTEYINTQSLERIKHYGDKNYQNMNNGISNRYEKFLVNNSILTANSSANATKNPSFYKFNILTDLTTSLTNNDSDNSKLSNNGSWLWDYFTKVTGETSKDLLETFIEFDKENIASVRLEQWFLKILDKSSDRTMTLGKMEFNSGWEDWNKEIDKSKVGTSYQEWKDIPLLKLDLSSFNFDELDKMFLPYKDANKITVNNLLSKLSLNNSQNFYNYELNLKNYITSSSKKGVK